GAITKDVFRNIEDEPVIPLEQSAERIRTLIAHLLDQDLVSERPQTHTSFRPVWRVCTGAASIVSDQVEKLRDQRHIQIVAGAYYSESIVEANQCMQRNETYWL